MIVLCLASLLVPGFESMRGRLADSLQDLAHFPIFAVICLLLIAVLNRSRYRAVSVPVSLAAAAGLGLLAEWIQPWVGRTRELGDVLIGLAGSAAAAACVHAWLRRPSARIRAGLCILAAGLALGALAPTAAVLKDQRDARAAFPVLGSFETPLETARWTANVCRLSRVKDHATDGRFALEMAVIEEGAYPGAFLMDMPRDWRAAARLCFDVWMPGAERTLLWVRVDDRRNSTYADRFQKAIWVEPGPNRICIDRREFETTPGGRKMDLGRLDAWGLFFDRARPGDRLVLDNLRLEFAAATPYDVRRRMRRIP